MNPIPLITSNHYRHSKHFSNIKRTFSPLSLSLACALSLARASIYNILHSHLSSILNRLEGFLKWVFSHGVKTDLFKSKHRYKIYLHSWWLMWQRLIYLCELFNAIHTSFEGKYIFVCSIIPPLNQMIGKFNKRFLRDSIVIAIHWLLIALLMLTC